MRTLVIGDIHGAQTALRQCFERSGFDAQTDRLIALGDVCDRGARVRECVEELLKIRHLNYILGNHDAWAAAWARTGARPAEWLSQGGEATVRSYGPEGMPEAHLRFFEAASLFWRENNRLFVHGGFDPGRSLEDQGPDIFLWDRNLLREAGRMDTIDPAYCFGGYEEVFLGHTQTRLFGSFEPIRFCNVWAVDTGAGGNGRLTIMDIETKQFWQSDFIETLADTP